MPESVTTATQESSSGQKSISSSGLQHEEYFSYASLSRDSIEVHETRTHVATMSCPAHDIESSTLTSNYNTDECTISKYQEDPPVLNQVFQRPVKRVFETYIHPRLPIFQSRVIFEVFSDNETVSQFVAFLRLALVAVSAPYINQQDIVAAGYKSRHQAISKFYEAAQVRLHNLDFPALR